MEIMRRIQREHRTEFVRTQRESNRHIKQIKLETLLNQGSAEMNY